MLRLIPIFIIYTALLFQSCSKGSKCTTDAKILYFGTLGECAFVVEIANSYYEPSNINEFTNFLNYRDTQLVKIDYQILPGFSDCNAIDKIQLFCVSDR